MIGYIYITTNLINKKMYIGKHYSSVYDPLYIGSGSLLYKAIQKYGIENFSNEIIDTAITEEELNFKEIAYIKEYKEKFGNNCYNIASGGTGGNALKYASEEQYTDFVNKMTIINRNRCSSDEFKNKISQSGKLRYSDINERIKQSERIRAYWNEDAKRKHSEIIKNMHKNYNGVWNNGKSIPCVMILNDNVYEFDTIKSLMKFFKTNYNWAPSREALRKIFNDSLNGIQFNPFRKNKLKDLIGMTLFKKADYEANYCVQSVETRTDECKSVEQEISTCSKCKTLN